MRRALIGWLLLSHFALLGQTPQASPEHAVIFIIDGLSYKAPERLPLTNLKTLIAAGTYYERSYNILPGHPKTGEWAKYNRSSIPNPVILAGTVLLRTDQQYVQQSFFPQRITAHVVNDLAYTSINVGHNMSFMAPSIGGRPVRDETAIGFALEFLRRGPPAFMRIHLQDTGLGGGATRDADRSVPWAGNIWAEGSPYSTNAIAADRCLGIFIDELKKLRMMEKTLLFVTADHGQADAGLHPPENEDSWSMPLIVVGPGIKAGQRVPYAEQIDIVPTLCYLMGVKPPSNTDGRILAEALTNPPANALPRKHGIRDLNQLLVEGEARIGRLRQQAGKLPSLNAGLQDAERDFYGLDRILQWQKFGSVDKLIAHNRAVLQKLPSPER